MRLSNSPCYRPPRRGMIRMFPQIASLFPQEVDLMRNAILSCALMLLCPALVAQQALDNGSVIKLVKAGLSEDLIVTTINSSPGSYDTSANGLIALKKAGVTNKVI